MLSRCVSWAPMLRPSIPLFGVFHARRSCKLETQWSRALLTKVVRPSFLVLDADPLQNISKVQTILWAVQAKALP